MLAKQSTSNSSMFNSPMSRKQNDFPVQEINTKSKIIIPISTADYAKSPAKALGISLVQSATTQGTLSSPKNSIIKSPTKNQENAKALKLPTGVIGFSRMGTAAFEKTPVIHEVTSTKSSKKNEIKVQERHSLAQPEEQTGPTEEEIKEKLYRVFQFYASFAERSQVGYLKSHRFTKMMVDAEIRDEYLNQSSLDLLFAGELRHSGNLDFTHFLNLLNRVAKVKFEYKFEEPEEAYAELLIVHIFPLYERLFKDDKTFDDDTKLASEPIDIGTSMAFQAVEDTLEGVFRTYFGFEIQTGAEPHVIKQRMENALFMFLREFGFCPELLSRGAAHALYANIMKEDLPTNKEALLLLNQSQSDISAKIKANKKNEKDKERDRNLPFSFEKFKLLLTRIANLAYKDLEVDTPTGPKRGTQMDRVVNLMEKMDISYRTLSPQKKASIQGAAKISSLLVSSEAVEKINMTVAKIEKEKKRAEMLNNKVTVVPGKGVIIVSGTDYTKFNIEDEEVIEQFEKNHVAIKRVFEYYCSFGEPLNISRLHAFKFAKLLKEGGLLRLSDPESKGYKVLAGLPAIAEALNTRDADIIVAGLAGPKQVRESNEKKLTYDNSIATPWLGSLNYLYKSNPLNLSVQYKMEWEAFLKALERVAGKVFSKAKTAGKGVKMLLDKHILKLDKQVEQVQKVVGSKPLKVLVDTLQNDEMVEFLGVVHKSIIVYYRVYADSMGMMNIEKFMHFCKDFNIFPTLMTKVKLTTFFHALAGIRAQAEETDVLLTLDSDANRSRRTNKNKVFRHQEQEDDVLDQHMFVEALALIALEVPYLNPQPSDMQKVFNLLEKLNQSNGPVKIRLQMGVTRTNNSPSWDVMVEVRARYPHLFSQPVDEEDVLRESLGN